MGLESIDAFIHASIHAGLAALHALHLDSLTDLNRCPSRGYLVIADREKDRLIESDSVAMTGATRVARNDKNGFYTCACDRRPHKNALWVTLF